MNDSNAAIGADSSWFASHVIGPIVYIACSKPGVLDEGRRGKLSAVEVGDGASDGLPLAITQTVAMFKREGTVLALGHDVMMC